MSRCRVFESVLVSSAPTTTVYWHSRHTASSVAESDRNVDSADAGGLIDADGLIDATASAVGSC